MWPFVREWETPQPRCGWDVCWTMTQGSALRATLGFGTESRWDSRRVEFESPHLSSNGAKSISTFVFPGGADLLLQRLIRKLNNAFVGGSCGRPRSSLSLLWLVSLAVIFGRAPIRHRSCSSQAANANGNIGSNPSLAARIGLISATQTCSNHSAKAALRLLLAISRRDSFTDLPSANEM